MKSKLESVTLKEPAIVALDTFTIQGVTEQGTYFEAAPNAWESLKTHLSDEELNDDFLGVFVGIGHDNPHDGEVREDSVRFSAGVTGARHLNINEIIIQEGMYAQFDYVGQLNNLGLAYHYIYGAWNNKSQTKIDHSKVAFMVFDTFPQEFGEYGVVIYVPLN